MRVHPIHTDHNSVLVQQMDSIQVEVIFVLRLSHNFSEEANALITWNDAQADQHFDQDATFGLLDCSIMVLRSV